MTNLAFKYTILYVDNVPETMAFYEKAFGFKQAMLHESHDYGELETGHTKLAFAAITLMTEMQKNPTAVNPERPTFEIAFETNDVEKALQTAINAGATLVQGAEHMPWGQTTAYVKDNNGFLVELCTPMA